MGAGSSPQGNDIFTALSHPLRRRILRTTIAAADEMSPRELAKVLSEPLSGLSYHVRVLAECGALRMTRTRQVRGSTEHFYRPAVKADWALSALAATEDPPRKGRARGEEKR